MHYWNIIVGHSKYKCGWILRKFNSFIENHSQNLIQATKKTWLVCNVFKTGHINLISENKHYFPICSVLGVLDRHNSYTQTRAHTHIHTHHTTHTNLNFIQDLLLTEASRALTASFAILLTSVKYISAWYICCNKRVKYKHTYCRRYMYCENVGIVDWFVNIIEQTRVWTQQFWTVYLLFR